MTTPYGSMAGELRGPGARLGYALAGHAFLTLRSTATGARYTYRVTRARGTDDGRPWFVAVLTGEDNTADYTYLGFIREGRWVHHASKSRIGADAPSARAFAWWWDHVSDERVEVWHDGRCGRCGRALTVPESVATGLGPVCAGKIAA